MKTYSFVFCLVLCVIVSECKVFTRCKLAVELLKTKYIQKTFLGSFIKKPDKCECKSLNEGSVQYNITKKKWFLHHPECEPDTHLKNDKRFKQLNFQKPSEVYPEEQQKQYSYINQMTIGVCLIEKVSNRDTKAFVVTPSGRKYYGLYQIPSRWCREGKKGGECNIACESLLDDDIRDDTACAVQIFQEEGFKYWTVWTTRCKNDDLITKEIYKCPDLTTPRISPERLSENLRTRRRFARQGMEKSSLRSYYLGLHWIRV